MEDTRSAVDRFRQSPESAKLSSQEFIKKLLELEVQEEEQPVGGAAPSVTPPSPQEAVREGPTEGVPVENALEQKILSGWRLPEANSAPNFRGLRPNEIEE